MNVSKIYWIIYDRRRFRVCIEKIVHNNQFIHYRITGRNKSFVMQSNEPLFRNRGIKHRRPDWKLIYGQIHTAGFLDAVILRLEQLRNEEIRQENKNLPLN